MEEMFLRNHFYIDPSLQARIKIAKIAFLGTGLASTLTEIMVRTGFTQFFLCDGDHVEISNLNRQNFTMSDIGKNKVEALKERLLAINPKITCTCLEARINSLDQVKHELEQSDVIINTVDCGSLYFDIIETYRTEKLVICPFNPGFGGMVVCFTPTSASAYDFFETKNACDDIQVAKVLLKKPGVTLTKQVGKQNEDFFHAEAEKGFFPQLGIGSALTSSIAATCVIDYLKKDTVLSAPKFYYIPSIKLHEQSYCKDKA